MALVVYDRVQETGTANTTVSFTLSGGVTGFQSFAVVGNGNTTYYAATDASGNYEVGLGTYSTTGPTLTRTTILSSSNSNLAVTFVGTCNIFVTYPAGKSVNLDASGNVTALGTVTSATLTNATGLPLTTGVTGTLPLANGGTGQTTAPAALANLLGWTTTVGTVSTINLTNTSSSQQNFTGVLSGIQNVNLPNTSTLALGWNVTISNQMTGSQQIQINTSTGVFLINCLTDQNYRFVCVSTSVNTAAAWQFYGAVANVDFTGTGGSKMVLATSPSLTSASINNLTASGVLGFTGSTTSNIDLGSAQTTGTLKIGGTSQTGTLTVGQSTVSQSTNIQAGATASASTKTINLGTGGLAGSTTTITIGSTTGTSTTTLNGAVSLTTGTISTTPSASTDIANKSYVDTVAQGLDTKASVVAGTTANITLSGTQTVDGVVLVAADRVLVKNQTASADNGLYLCAAGAWTRTTDMNTWAQVPGAYVFVETGTTLADTGWVCTSNAGGTLGTTAITWAQFSGAGSGVSSITFGSTGLTPATATTGAVTVAGTLAATNGGTGQSSYAVGDVLYASTTTALSKLADVATGNALISGGVGVAPSYGKIGLTTHVSGTLPVANGGTNASTASITSFNNITGYTAAGATGTTSTNLVFSTSPSLTTPTIGGGGANFSGSTSGTTTLKASAVAGANTITMQATSGTVAFTTDIPSVNNGTLTMAVSGTGLSGSQTFTANQSSSATFTVTSNATNANTASTIVARDASGNFTAGTITAALTGNASTATTAAGLSATLVATSGGTGQSSYAVGDILYASTTTALSKLADVATGNALISGGIGVAPSWGKIGLTTHVSGTLPIANGGTNATATPTAGGAVYGTGTAYAITAAGTAGQVLTSNGASAPTWGAAPTATAVTLPSTNPFVQNATTLSANLTITGNNAMAAGPITINTSVTLTIATGARVVIV